MYRVLSAVFFCMSVASVAPQDASEVTFVQPLTRTSQETPQPVIKTLETIPITTSKDQYKNDETTPSTESEQNQYTKTESAEVSTAVYETTEREYVSEEPRTPVPRVKPWKTPVPRFVSKLGYFKNTNTYSNVGQTNFIERTGKRTFTSHCRCEKISNCPKLQISIARCPEAYFLCCFPYL